MRAQRPPAKPPAKAAATESRGPQRASAAARAHPKRTRHAATHAPVPPPPPSPSPPPHRQRHLGRTTLQTKIPLVARYARSWAVVVGIDRYRSPAIRDLGYSVADALGMAKALVTQLGFPREQVFIALDPWPEVAVPWGMQAGPATKQVVESLLFTRLPEVAGPDDRVLVFFAGHGERRHLPDGRSEAGYLIPADAEADQWHTCIDLEAVMRAGNLCAAKHVFYLIDACYSGLATARAQVRERRYEETMLTARARQVLTAGTARQTVADRGPQGHSLFTWYVLQGLSGGANLFRQGVVTGSQLMVYVRNQVAQAFGSEQMPDFGVLPGHESGGDFVFVEPAFSAADYFALGQGLRAVARVRGDLGRLRAAASAFQAAIDAGGADRGAAWHALGECQLALGDVPAAVTSLHEAEAQGMRDAALPLGLALDQQRDTAGAIAALVRFTVSVQEPKVVQATAAPVPSDPREADAPSIPPAPSSSPAAPTDIAWARALADRWGLDGCARRHALLIAVGDTALQDLRELRALLIRRFAFCPREVRLISGNDATRGAILQALDRLASLARPHDEVLVALCGTGAQIRASPALRTRDRLHFVFLTTDFRRRNLTEPELMEALARIPGRMRLLIADAPHVALDAAVARRIGWHCLAACGRSGLSFEQLIDGRMRGVFMLALMQVLDAAGPGTLAWSQVRDKVEQRQKERFDAVQRPVWIGPTREALWQARPGPESSWLYALAEHLRWDDLDEATLSAWQALLSPEAPPTPPQSAVALARALTRRGRHGEALQALEHAVRCGLGDDLDARLLQMRVMTQAGQANQARAVLDAWMPSNVPVAELPHRSRVRDACAPWLDLLVQDNRRALLVGVGQGLGKASAPLPQVARDIEAIRQWLIDRFGWRPEAIVTLADGFATRNAVVQAYQTLCGQAAHAPCFFHFSGPGSVDPDGEPVLRLADSEPADLSLAELRQWALPVQDNLITVVDANFTVNSGDVRYAEPVPTEGILYWDFTDHIAREDPARYRIGRLSVFDASLATTKRGAQALVAGRDSAKGTSERAVTAAKAATRHRRLRLGHHRDVSQALVQALATSPEPGGRQEALTPLDTAALRRALVNTDLLVLADDSTAPLWANRVVLRRLQQALDHCAAAPVHDAIRLLMRLRQTQGTDDARWSLELALSESALPRGDSEAVEAMDTPTALLLSAESLIADALDGLKDPADRADAHLHLAQWHLQAGRPDAAVTHLEQAIDEAPERAEAHYQIGRALRQLIEQDLSQRLRRSWQRYLALNEGGVHDAEVRSALAARAPDA